MHDQTGLLALAERSRSAANASAIRRALRASILGIPLGDPDREALESGIKLLDQAVRASTAQTTEARTASTFSGETQALKLVRETAPVLIDIDCLQRIRDSLAEIRSGQTIDKSLVSEALELFARINRRAIESFRSIEQSNAIETLIS